MRRQQGRRTPATVEKDTAARHSSPPAAAHPGDQEREPSLSAEPKHTGADAVTGIQIVEVQSPW